MLPRQRPPSLRGISTFLSTTIVGNVSTVRMALAPGVGEGMGMLGDERCGLEGGFGWRWR